MNHRIGKYLSTPPPASQNSAPGKENDRGGGGGGSVAIGAASSAAAASPAGSSPSPFPSASASASALARTTAPGFEPLVTPPSSVSTASNASELLASERRMLDSMLRVASSERGAALRQTSALASSERLASLSSRVLSDASEARRQLAKEYATRRLEASRGAVELAAKALMRERDARDWLYRWARACRAKRVAKSAGRGMRRRYALRNLRRALAGWRAQAAHATGARRVVAARVGAARGGRV